MRFHTSLLIAAICSCGVIAEELDCVCRPKATVDNNVPRSDLKSYTAEHWFAAPTQGHPWTIFDAAWFKKQRIDFLKLHGKHKPGVYRHDATLSRYAQWYANKCAAEKRYRHSLPDALKSVGATAENIQINGIDAATAWKLLLDSPGHKAAIDDHTYVGVGVAVDSNNVIYWISLYRNKR